MLQKGVVLIFCFLWIYVTAGDNGGGGWCLESRSTQPSQETKFEQMLFKPWSARSRHRNVCDVMGRNDNQTEEKDVCYSSLYKLYCNVKCGTKIGLCIEKLCYCVYALKASRRRDGPSMIFIARPEDIFDESQSGLGAHQLYGKNVIEMSPQSSSDLSTFPMRPALRHHIAHFCPNLEVAKECIRTCMKEGKPAFCGKDHVCYCGHKYNSRDKTSNDKLAETYGEFHDMYEKYFGTHNFEEKSSF